MENATTLLAAGLHLNTGGGLGGIIFLVGWIWLIVMGFQHHLGWGLLVLLLPGLGGIVFGMARWPATKVPFIILIVGLLLGGGMMGLGLRVG